MTLMKYKDIIGMAKDKINEVMVPLRAREMKKKAELEIAKLEGAIFEHEQKIQQHASEYPINFDKLIESIDDLQIITRRKKQFEEIVQEMFAE